MKASGDFKGIEDVEEGKEYIEMDLGLGVLEEQKDGMEGSKEEEEEKEVNQHMGEGQDEDILAKMMGMKKGKINVGISEVE